MNISKMSPLLVLGAKFYKVVVSNFKLGIIQLFTKVEQKQNNFRLCDPPYCTTFINLSQDFQYYISTH